MNSRRHPDVVSRNALPRTRRGRLGHRCRLQVEWLEDRILLSGPADDVLAGVAIPLVLGAPTSGTLAAGSIVFYQVNPGAEGKLVAQVEAGGDAMRLSLLNGQDQVLAQSDGQSPANPSPLIGVDVPAGPEYLELENQGAASAYTVTASLLPASTPFQTIPIATVTAPFAVAAGDFSNNGRTDLAVADYSAGEVSVLMGNGDGTFQPQATYTVGSGPYAIIAGALGNDGQIDLAVVNNIDGTVSVLLGNGDGTFQQPATTYTVGTEPIALVAGDFTGDGRIDLAVANSGDGTVSVLQGNGDGTFQQQPATYTVGTAPEALAAGDFNGDGLTDLAVANTGSNDVSILLADGAGGFESPLTYVVGSHPDGIVADNFTAGGPTDLAVANQSDGTVSVLLGNGNGTFQTPSTYTVGGQPYALVAGDFTGNGRTDLAVTNAASNTVSVLLGNGDGTFGSQVTYAVGGDPGGLAAGDFNGDGRIDLAVANSFNDVSVLLGNGDGTFAPQTTYAVGPGPSAVVAGDFTGSGETDLAIANSGANDVSVLLGNGDGTFQPPVTYPVGTRPVALVTGNFTDDGHLDLAVANSGANDISVLLGNGDGTFEAQVTYAVGSYPSALVAGDFNGDGRTDLAVANAGSNDVSVLLGKGNGSFAPQVTYTVGTAPVALVAGDFTAAGRTDLAIVNQGDNDVSVLLGNGDGTFRPLATYAVGTAPVAIVAGDFTGTGRTDLAVANSGGNDVSVLLGNGDGTFLDQVTYAVGTSPAALVAADFNGDGRTDLAVANSGDNDVSVLLGNGDGSFQSQVTYAVGFLPVALVAGPFTGNGRVDLATVNGGSGDISVLLGNSGGTFQSQVTNAVGSFPLALAAGDFTGDGRTDLAVANNDANDISVLLGNGDGTFQTQVTYAVGSHPYAIVSGDFNGDGRTDLAVVNYGDNSGDGSVSVLLGNGDGTFQPQVTYDVGSQPTAIVAGDFTGDGVIDLAVANMGSNNISVLLGRGDGTFLPQVTYPVGNGPDAIVAGDFSGDGHLDLAVANSGSDDVSVLLGNGNGTFGSEATYSVGSFPDALATGRFTSDGPIDLVAANFSDGTVSVLLGNGNGTFQPQVPYAVGNQPTAVVTGDYNGDGLTDLAVANQGDGTVSVLLGTGTGTFQPQTPYNVDSGPSGLVAGDFNGDGLTALATANSYANDVSVLLNVGGTFVAPGPYATTPQAAPVVADLTGDGLDDVFVVDAAGDILWRRAEPQAPGTYEPPVTINPGHPSRDIVAVATNQGMVLASVDATDDLVSLYAFQNGSFTLIDSLPTGLLPAQVVTADLTGDGTDDLVVRNAGDGTLSVYFNTISGTGPFSPLLAPFLPPLTLTVGPGVSDVTAADVSGAGRTDLVVTYQTTGEVGVLENLAPGVFSTRVLYPAGNGLYAVTVPGSGGPATLTTFEATAGVAAGALTTGGPADLVAINPGSSTLSVLSGLGSGRFANPVTVPTASPPIAVLVADLEADGVPDTIVLSASGVTVYRGNGQGGFLPDPFTIAAGPEPTGMTIADINGDGMPDLLVSNAYGDLLLLLGGGNGTFHTAYTADQNVAMAVFPNGSASPDFILADQDLDQVVVDYAAAPPKTVADRTSGLLAPGAVVLADLNGDGIPDLIVANSGSNNVLVYPGLGNGQFGPELNGGKGFATGTNPVGITVANLNGRPDLIVANEGSNDVSILLNVATADGGFTFVPGPRLQGGVGPTSTAVMDVPGDPFPDLLISDAGANQVRLLRGVGGGFFADQDPRTYAVGVDPIQVMTGPFLPNQGPEILTVNRGSNDVTVISDFAAGTPITSTYLTGGIEPVAAFGLTLPDQPLESLFVANEGDGLFSLLGGPGGLELEQTVTTSNLPEPTALELATVSGNTVSFYAATAGTEAVFTVDFLLPGFPGPEVSVSAGSSAATDAPLQLVAFGEGSQALIVTVLNTGPGAALAAAAETPADVNTAFLSVPPSQGQGVFGRLSTSDSESDEAVETTAPGAPVAQGALVAPWVRSILGVDEIIHEIRRENGDALQGKGDALREDSAPAASDKAPAEKPEGSLGLLIRAGSVQWAGAPARNPSLSVAGRLADVRRAAEAVDQAIAAIAALAASALRPISWRAVESLQLASQVEPLHPDSRAARPVAAVPAWVSALIAGLMVVKTNMPGRPRRRVRPEEEKRRTRD